MFNVSSRDWTASHGEKAVNYVISYVISSVIEDPLVLELIPHEKPVLNQLS
jgi:uncharacterized Tic20 family protein